MLRHRFYVEAALGSLTAALAVLTLLWHDWLEALTGADPDRFSGAFEWTVVVVCAMLAVACALLARREWRRAAE